VRSHFAFAVGALPTRANVVNSMHAVVLCSLNGEIYARQSIVLLCNI